MSQFNDYYANGGAGGGGYLQGGSPFGGNGSPGGIRRTEASHSLRPLTVAQLIKAKQAHTDAEWTVDDLEIGQITVVGQVQSIQAQTTNCVYWIDDGTGRIEARHWIDSRNDEDDQKWGGIQDNAYVRLTGALKMFGSKRYVNLTHIRLVKDSHEIYFHLFEVVAVKLMLERGMPSGMGQTAQRNPSSIPSAPSAYTHTKADVVMNDAYSNLPALHQAIVRFINDQPLTDEGIHVAAIARSISKLGNARNIDAALEFLMDEGHVFTTVDDSHFNVTR